MSAMKHSKSEVLLAVLIDIPPEDAAIVLTFEDAVLPLLNRHGGQLQRRLRAVDQSAELQIISFDSREAQEAFATDPSRLQLMRLLQAASSDNLFSTLQSPPLTMAPQTDSVVVYPKVKPDERSETVPAGQGYPPDISKRPNPFAQRWTARCSRSPASPYGGCQAA